MGYKPNDRKVLIITGYYGQKHDIAAVRMRSLVKYLCKNSWQVFILYRQKDQQEDLSEVPSGLSIYKVKMPVILKDIKINKIYLRPMIWIMEALAAGLFYLKAVIQAEQIIANENISRILVSVPPLAPLIIAGIIKRRKKQIKIIEEIRDVIGGNEIYKTHSRIGNKAQELFERVFIKYVDEFIYYSPLIETTYLSKYKKHNDNISSGRMLFRGYDHEMFRVTDKNVGRDPELININYFGTFSTTRMPYYFLELFGGYVSVRPEAKHAFKINFWSNLEGRCLEKAKSIVENYGIKGNVIFNAMLPNEKAAEVMINSSINLIITHRWGSDYAIPGKFYDYVGSGRPILAITNDKLLTKMIEADRLGWVCPYDDKKTGIKVLDYIMGNKRQINVNTHKVSTSKYSDMDYLAGVNSILSGDER